MAKHARKKHRKRKRENEEKTTTSRGRKRLRENGIARQLGYTQERKLNEQERKRGEMTYHQEEEGD